MNTANKIFTDKVNKENFELVFSEFKDFVTPNYVNKFDEKYLDENTGKIYNMFINIENSR